MRTPPQERLLTDITMEMARLEILVRRSRGTLKDPRIRTVLRRLDELRADAREQDRQPSEKA